MIENRTISTLSRVVSTVWNPVTMPLYAVLALLYGDTVLSPLPQRLKLYYVALVALTTVVIPALSIALMRSMGLVSRLALDERRERIAPMAMALICYAACLFVLRPSPLVFLVRQALAAGIASLALGLAVTFLWKISLHGIAAGAMISILALVHIAGMGHLFGMVCAAILLGGAVASSRLVLRKHTPAQVAAGFFGGMAAGAAAMLV